MTEPNPGPAVEVTSGPVGDGDASLPAVPGVVVVMSLPVGSVVGVAVGVVGPSLVVATGASDAEPVDAGNGGAASLPIVMDPMQTSPFPPSKTSRTS